MQKLLYSLISEGKYEALRGLWNFFRWQMKEYLTTSSQLKEYLTDFCLSESIILALLSEPDLLGFSEDELFHRPDVQRFLTSMLSESNWATPTRFSENLRSFIGTSQDLVSRLHRRALVFPESVPSVAAWMYSMYSNFGEISAWIPLKGYLDGYLDSRANQPELVHAFWARCAQIKNWSYTHLSTNLISSQGVPDVCLLHWARMASKGQDLIPRLDYLTLLQSLPPNLIDGRRLRTYYYAGSPSPNDVEAFAAFASKIPVESPWAPVLIVSTLNIVKKLQWAQNCYPKTAKLIARWCERPEWPMLWRRKGRGRLARSF
jgi:hypothetical protein